MFTDKVNPKYIESYCSGCGLCNSMFGCELAEDNRGFPVVKATGKEDELIKICRAHGLKAPSGKIELNKVIEAYFSGEKILPDRKKRFAGAKRFS